MITAGIDVGSVSTEMVILQDGNIIGSKVIDTGSNSRHAAERVCADILESSGMKREEIDFIVTTGYGRKSSDVGDLSVTELSCHARGAWQIDSRVRMVVDIGGQDSKVIRVGKNGKSIDFVMNDKCAAGTGRFLEIIAKALELQVSDLGVLALGTDDSITISSMCAVFAESEVVSLIAEGHPKEIIVAGVLDSIANRVGGMAHRVGLAEPAMLTGGVAKNIGMKRAIEKSLGLELIVPDEPQIIGAYGAGLIAMDELEHSTQR
jgi:predicted CoA-substrate-specific enzyme activase